MAHILAFIVIALIKILNWVLIKSRLFIVAIPMAIVMIFYKEIYENNASLFIAISVSITIIIISSWIVTFFKYLKVVRNNKKTIMEWSKSRYDYI